MAVQTVYVALLNEAVNVWRPVEAKHIEADLYRLTGPIVDGEEWEFKVGNVVRCEMRVLSADSGKSEPVMVAYEKVL